MNKKKFIFLFFLVTICTSFVFANLNDIRDREKLFKNQLRYQELRDDDDGGDDECKKTRDCPNLVCNTKKCQRGVCIYTPMNCMDNDACTTNERCEYDQCVSDLVPDCCNHDNQCGDSHPCTTNERCDQGSNTCIYDPVPNCCNIAQDCEATRSICKDAQCISNECIFHPKECSDNHPCTQNERCEMDQCVFDSTPGCCSTSYDCQDNDPCTTNEYCDIQSGECHFNTVANCCVTDYDCTTAAPSCQIGTCNGFNQCEYNPRDCQDNDPCTENEYCDVYSNTCKFDITPGCEPSPCQDCCNHNPLFQEQILIANRGNTTTTVIYADSEQVRSTIIHPSTSEPLYINSPGCCGNDGPIGESKFFWVGDRTESKVRKFDSRTLEEIAALSTCNGVFHMYYHLDADQLWVICDIDKGMTVVRLSTTSVIQAFVPIPAEFVATYKPHDITLSTTSVYVSLLGAPDFSLPSQLIEYSTSTFLETRRLELPANAHLFHTGVPGDFLFAACQQDNSVLVVDILTLTIKDIYHVPNAHGIWEQGGVVYVLNIGAMDPTGTFMEDLQSPLNVPDTLWLFTYNQQGILSLIQGSPFNLPANNPHNIIPTFSRHKLFIDHTASSQLSVCDLDNNGIPILPCRLVNIPSGSIGIPESESVGLQTPMGIGRMKPLCDCYTSCTDFEPCTVNEYCDENIGICRFDLDPDCDGLPDCPHNVNITIHDCSKLVIVEKPQHIYEFCHTSSFLGEESAVVLSFDPYDDCELNKRGTCDNRLSVHEEPSHYCLHDALYDDNGCSLVSGDHALSMQGFVDNFVWNNTTPMKSTFTYDEQAGTGHIQGILVGVENPNVVLKMDLWLSGILPEGQIPSSPSPFANLPTNCYVENGGQINTTEWRYFTTAHGSLTGVHDTPYAGLHITIGTPIGSLQFGYGANNKNDHFGLGGWFTWLVSNQPYDHYLHVNNPTTVADINVDVDHNCTVPIDYCELFGEPQVPPANGWEVVVSGHSPWRNITYCKDFSLDELLSCRSYEDPNTRLFGTEQSEDYVLTYNGTLYANTLLPLHCEYHDYDGICGEIRPFDTQFDIKITIDAKGTVSVSYISKAINLQVRWLKNVWLMGEEAGNIKVVIETKIMNYEQSYPHEETTKLINGFIDTAKETGYPLTITDDTPPCTYHDNYCIQEWCLVSENARQNNVDDFSGGKPIVFTLEVNGHPRQDIYIHIDLKAKHIGSQQHLNGEIDASLQLYLDKDFHYLYEYAPNKPLYDCSNICGLLELEYQRHLKLKLQKVYICYLIDGNIPPYDPHYPDQTGCNTPGAIHKLAYSTDPYENVGPEHYFEIVEEPPFYDFQEGFCLQVHAYTYYKQIIQVHWHAEEVGGEGGIIEKIVEYDMGDGSRESRHYDDYHSNTDYAVHCPHGLVYSYEARKCKARIGTYGYESNHDDDDDNSYVSHPPSYYNKYSPKPHRKSHGHGNYGNEYNHDRSHSNTNVFTVIVIILILIAILCALLYLYGIVPGCWCCKKNLKTYTYPSFHSITQVQQNNVHVDDRDTINIHHHNTNTNTNTNNNQTNIHNNNTQLLHRNTTNIQNNHQQYQQQNIYNVDDVDFIIPN